MEEAWEPFRGINRAKMLERGPGGWGVRFLTRGSITGLQGAGVAGIGSRKDLEKVRAVFKGRGAKAWGV